MLMVGRRNESGQKLQCNHCGYQWFYTGDKQMTSCPRCSWRKRVYVSAPGSERRPVDDFNKTDQLF